MAHQIEDFEIHAGDDLVVPVIVTDDGTATGTPIDLTSAQEIVFAVADRDEANTRSITKKLTTVGVTLTDAPAGKYEVLLSAADTFGKFGWKNMQSRVTDVAGDKFTSFSGLLNINKSILLADE